MPSLKYEILHLSAFDPRTPQKKGKRIPSSNTIEQHKTNARRFGDWCKTTYNCRHAEDCRQHIQDYADYLLSSGKSADTVHTYLAGVCFAYGVEHMSEIDKPMRRAVDVTRSRGHKAVDNRAAPHPRRSCSAGLSVLSGAPEDRAGLPGTVDARNSGALGSI